MDKEPATYSVERAEDVATQIQFSCFAGETEVGRASIIFAHSEAHSGRVGYIHDLFVDKKFRSGQVGDTLVAQALTECREHQCYKVVAVTRSGRKSLQALYRRNGFVEHGLEFRVDL